MGRVIDFSTLERCSFSSGACYYLDFFFFLSSGNMCITNDPQL